MMLIVAVVVIGTSSTTKMQCRRAIYGPHTCL